jgi:hypothetical protein
VARRPPSTSTRDRTIITVGIVVYRHCGMTCVVRHAGATLFVGRQRSPALAIRADPPIVADEGGADGPAASVEQHSIAAVRARPGLDGDGSIVSRIEPSIPQGEETMAPLAAIAMFGRFAVERLARIVFAAFLDRSGPRERRAAVGTAVLG